MATKKTTTKKTTKRRKKSSGTQIIPGVNLTISWKKLLGITQLKRWFTKKTGIPTTETGMERKIGRWLIGLITGGSKKEEKKTEQLSVTAEGMDPSASNLIDINQENEG